MKKFTLSVALNHMKSRLLITILVFAATYTIVSSGYVFEDKYSTSKIIVPANIKAAEGAYIINTIDANRILLLLSNPGFKMKVSQNLEKDQFAANYKVSSHKNNANSQTVQLDFKGGFDDVFYTAKSVIHELGKFDSEAYDQLFEKVRKNIKTKEELLLMTKSNYESFVKDITDDQLREYADMQNTYEDFYNKTLNSLVDADRASGIQVAYRKFISDKLPMEKSIYIMDSDIRKLKMDLEREFGIKKVSYLFPVLRKDIGKYYPNVFVYIGTSLFMAFLYNLISLHYYYNKYTKPLI